jgi:hypothetical protein
MKEISSISVPMPKDASDVERWHLLVHAQTYRQQPLIASLSYPVPVPANNGLLLAAFYYANQAAADGQPLGVKPIGVNVLATYPEGRVSHVDSGLPEQLFPAMPAANSAKWPTGEPQVPGGLWKNRKVLLNKYPAILDDFWKHAEVAGERMGFFKLFVYVAYPELMPYYYALNPAFFDWLRG